MKRAYYFAHSLNFNHALMQNWFFTIWFLKINRQNDFPCDLVLLKSFFVEWNLILLQESVDTPVVERRHNKSWLTRTINRVGSIRSSSTTYSSGGIFRQARRNSTYSSPETGTLPAGNVSISSANPAKETNGSHKMSFYDRLAGRKSGRSAKLRPGKLNWITN